jgi:hypothetical protein
MIKLLEFLRKVVTVLEMFSENFEKTIMNTIFKIAITKVKQFEALKSTKPSVGHKKGSQEWAGAGVSSDENYETLVIEIAETLSRFTIALKNNIKESDLFILLNSSVPIIQKSALFLLQHYYENIPIQLPDDYLVITEDKLVEAADSRVLFPELMIQTIEKHLQPVEIDVGVKTKDPNFQKKKIRRDLDTNLMGLRVRNTTNTEHIGYILTWIVLMYKLKNPREDRYVEAERMYYLKYLSRNQEVYSSFLRNLFNWVRDLRLNEKELMKKLEDLNITELDQDWTHYIDINTGIQLHIHAYF